MKNGSCIHLKQDIREGNAGNISRYYYSFFTRRYEDLTKYYIRTDSIMNDLDDYVGRERLEKEIDEYIANHPSGIVLVDGDAGVGKTTFLAHLVKKHRYPHCFGKLAPGDGNLPRAIQSLAAQLIVLYQIDGYSDRLLSTEATRFKDFLDGLFWEVAEKQGAGEKVVIVCDALDEAGIVPGGNALGLPAKLPDGFFLILSQKKGINVRLDFEHKIKPFTIDQNSGENKEDIKQYLYKVACEPDIKKQYQAKGFTQSGFVDTILNKSDGLWIYVKHVVNDFRSGRMDFDSLPDGLANYYAEFFKIWRNGTRGKGEEFWGNLYGALLGLFGAVKEPIPAGMFSSWCSLDEKEVERLLNEDWKSYFSVINYRNVLSYATNHTSINDWINGKAEYATPENRNLGRELRHQVNEAHKKIVQYYRDQFRGDWINILNLEYPRQYISHHMAEAGLIDELSQLLTHSDSWAKKRFELEGHYAGYQNDLANLASHLDRSALHFGYFLRVALCRSSTVSNVAGIDPKLLIECVKTGLFTFSQALTYAGQKPDLKDNVQAVIHLAEQFPNEQTGSPFLRMIDELFGKIIKMPDSKLRIYNLGELIPFLDSGQISQALELTGGIGDEEWRAMLLGELAGKLKGEQVEKALELTGGIGDEEMRAMLLGELAGKLEGEQVEKALELTGGIWDEERRAMLLVELAGKLKGEQVEKALGLAGGIWDEERRAMLLVELARKLEGERKEQVLGEALELAGGIVGEGWRAWLLGKLAGKLEGERKEQVLRQALELTGGIVGEGWRASLLGRLAGELEGEQVEKALELAGGIGDEDDRAMLLGKLAGKLEGERKEQVLGEALELAGGIGDKGWRGWPLVTLAGKLEGEQVEKALGLAGGIRDEERRAMLLGELAGKLEGEQVEKALELTGGDRG